jgi:hypothetical protein
MIVGLGGGVVDVEQHLRFRARDGDIAVAAEAVEDAAQQIDVGFRHEPRLELLARAQRTGAVDDGILDLIEGETHQALRRPARLVEHVDQQLQLGLGLHPAVPADAIEQPLGVLGGQVPLGLGLLDQIVGDGLDEAVGPGGILHRAGVVQGEDGLGFLGRDDAVVVVAAAHLEDIGVLDAAARLDFRDRDRAQYCHRQPPVLLGAR